MPRKVLDELQLFREKTLRQSDFQRKPLVILSTENCVGEGNFLIAQSFRLSATIQSEFYVDSMGDLPYAVKVAKSQIARELYGDIEGLVLEVLHHIYGGDAQGAANACKKILDYIKPE